jgi:2-polyprenyl-6-methoxyphenol hydroxylase-like FAD-dependent oxidoreductase
LNARSDASRNGPTEARRSGRAGRSKETLVVQPTLPTRTDVLIVGAGPVGLTLAASLELLNVDYVLIDRQKTVQPGSKAAAVQPRTLEYLARIGVSDPLIRDAAFARGFRLQDGAETLLHARYDGLDTPFPYVLLASQESTEKQLQARLEELGGAVLREHRYVSHRDDFPGVGVTVAGPDGGLRAITARYLVGCDGVHSAVRQETGIGFPGRAPEQLFALADVVLGAGAPEAAAEDTTFFLSSRGMLLVSPLAGGRHRVVASVPAGTGAPAAADVERLLSARGAGEGVRVAELVASSVYRVQERVADRFREGPVFLAGDAAHTHSPAGGQGMNTGIQDAGNLAWKLHAVLSAMAPESLLDTYDAERRPVAVRLVSFTGQFARLANVTGMSAELRNTALGALGAAPGISDWVATRLAQLDVHYADQPSGSDIPVPGQRVSASLVPGTDLRWTLALGGSAGAHDPGAPDGPLRVRHVEGLATPMLIRPDGYLAASGVPADPARVRGELPQYLPGSARH